MGTLRDNVGFITAPDLDADGYYDFNLDCIWLIQVEPGKVILYEFEYILLAKSTTRDTFDYINVSRIRTCCYLI